MNTRSKILFCDDDPLIHMAFKQQLGDLHDCSSVYSVEEGLNCIKNRKFDVLILDVNLKSPGDGLKGIEKFRALDPDLSILMSSGQTDYETMREAMQRGAVDFVSKGFEVEEITLAVVQVLEKRKMRIRTEQFSHEAMRSLNKIQMVGKSASVERLRVLIEKAKKSKANVVITGETGTGKEAVAKLMRGMDEDGNLVPFVAVDSATIQGTRAESHLFGHEKGAFTGADRTIKGVFEDADGGIVYFDEIANMPLDIQVKLLRVLQEKEITRVGSTRPIPLQFRVIAATNQSLEKLVSEGKFKDDLYQRLSVIPLSVPPLRERTDDLQLLVAHFLKQETGNEKFLAFKEATLEALQGYAWPGNVRELQNLISYLVSMCDFKEIEISDLPGKLQDALRKNHEPFSPSASTSLTEEKQDDLTYYQKVEGYEKQLLISEFQKSDGNISKFALKLKMDRSHLYSKLKQFGIHNATK